MLKVTSGALIPKPARVGYYSWVTPRKETLAPMGGIVQDVATSFLQNRRQGLLHGMMHKQIHHKD